MEKLLKKISELNAWFDEVPEPQRSILAMSCAGLGTIVGRAGIVWVLMLIAVRLIGVYAGKEEEK